ncbi:MAG: hypothetical protein PVF68_05370 [Acidobacteriota bacterium]|jgi:hypothetical protein
MRARGFTVVILVALLASTASMAKLAKADRKEAKAMAKEGRLYMRIDAPCATGVHAYGTYKRPLVEVSPDGVNTDGDQAMSYGWWHADSTFWGISINDPVEVDEIDFDDDEVEIELEGVGRADDNATTLKLVKIESLDDFKAAFDRTFSRVPLQDEHEDWSAEIKEAISERRLVEGMSKRQAYYVTGTPERFEKTEEDGAEVETWFLRQDKGMKMGYWGGRSGGSTGLPSSIRFVDGKLADFAEVGSGEGLDLDD